MEATLVLAGIALAALVGVGLTVTRGRLGQKPGGAGERLQALQILVQTRLPDADQHRPNPYEQEPRTGAVRVLDEPRESTATPPRRQQQHQRRPRG